jgi:hypothetical protein
LVKIKVEMLPLIWRDHAHISREVVLEAEEAIQEMLKLVKFANIYIVSKLVKEFNKRSELLDSGFDFELKDLDVIFTLNFLKVD